MTANSNNTPQQLTPGYKETSELVLGTSQPTKVTQSENHYIHNINVTIQACYTVSCMNNNLVCGCTIGIDCSHVMPHTICHNPLRFYNYYLVAILHANSVTIIYKLSTIHNLHYIIKYIST